jgi:hypothetical protein
LQPGLLKNHTLSPFNKIKRLIPVLVLSLLLSASSFLTFEIPFFLLSRHLGEILAFI